LLPELTIAAVIVSFQEGYCRPRSPAKTGNFDPFPVIPFRNGGAPFSAALFAPVSLIVEFAVQIRA